jgi:hypothetical protein
VGTQACAPVGSACPAGELPDDLPAEGPLVFVDDDATGGDGTRSAPYGSIVEAVSAAEGGTVVLAKGDYDAGFIFDAQVTLVGACAAETRLVGTSRQAVVTVTGGPVGLRELTVVGSGPGLVVTGEVELASVVIEEATFEGIDVRGGTLRGERVRVAHVDTPTPGGPRGPRAVRVDGGTVRLRRAVLEDVGGFGVTVEGGGQVTLEDFWIRAIDTQVDGRGQGVYAREESEVEGRRGLIERTRRAGLELTGSSSGLLEDVVVRDLSSEASSREWGAGVLAVSGSRFTGRRLFLERTRDAALRAENGAELRIEDVRIDDTRPNERGLFGEGIHVEEGRGVARRVAIRGSSSVNISARMTELDVEDLSVDSPEGSLGVAAFGSTGRFHRCRLDNTGPIAIVLARQSEATFTDVEVRGTRAATGAFRRTTDDTDLIRAVDMSEASDASFERVAIVGGGDGVAVRGGRLDGTDLRVQGITEVAEEWANVALYGSNAALRLERVHLEDLPSYAMRFIEGTDAVVQDVVARDVRFAEPLGAGVALSARSGSSVQVERLLVDGTVGYGVDVANPGTRVTLAHARLIDSESDPTSQMSGTAVAVYLGGALEGDRMEIATHRQTGVVAADEGTTVAVDELHVDNGRGVPKDGTFGHGVDVLDGARFEAREVELEAVRGAGLRALGPAARVELGSLSVRDMDPLQCKPECSLLEGGLVLGDGATAAMRALTVDGVPGCGFFVGDGARLDVDEGTVRRSTIGACIFSEAQDIEALARRLRFEDNERNLDAVSVPVPSVSSVPDGLDEEVGDSPFGD